MTKLAANKFGIKMAFQATNPVLKNEDGWEQVFQRNTTSINWVTPILLILAIHREFLESRFTIKSGVAIPNIVRTNDVAQPMTDACQLLEVNTFLVVVIQGFNEANPIGGIIKPPEAGSAWFKCLPDGWTKVSTSTTYNVFLQSFLNASRGIICWRYFGR